MQYAFLDKGPYVLVPYFFDNVDECRKAVDTIKSVEASEEGAR
jgi:hypothetical protein